MDAPAITLGSNGGGVGAAPMGAALTTRQITLLRSHLHLADGRHCIAVATDPDPAGWTSAQKAFWQLTAVDLDPTLLELPDGTDPARLYATRGADAITAAINNRLPLGDVMIDQLLRTAGQRSDPHVRPTIITQAARILGARGPDTWLPAFARRRNRLHLSPGILEHQTITESRDRTRHPTEYARALTLPRCTDVAACVRPSSGHCPA